MWYYINGDNINNRQLSRISYGFQNMDFSCTFEVLYTEFNKF